MRGMKHPKKRTTLCPYCNSSEKIQKRGFFIRTSDKKKIQKYYCLSCSKHFSEQTLSYDYRLRKRYINQRTFRLLCKGVSQRGAALLLGVKPKAIALRIKRFAKVARGFLAKTREQEDLKEVFFDEMETFEHTKCKPVTIPLAVNPANRKILALATGKIPAKGLLVKTAMQRYGPRECQRKEKLAEMLTAIASSCETIPKFITDKSPFYPNLIKEMFPEAVHESYKGRRGCVVGQGELKAGGHDPLFALNHTCAMVRDNIKRMTRRTWCTTKKIPMLENMLYIYAMFHNLVIDGFPLEIFNC
jgi:transposase-like protein/IS1 family transposase